MTTIYDVARVAGVSTATVSRVLRGSDARPSRHATAGAGRHRDAGLRPGRVGARSYPGAEGHHRAGRAGSRRRRDRHRAQQPAVRRPHRPRGRDGAARDRVLPAADVRQPRRAVREAGACPRRPGRRPHHRRGSPGPGGTARPGRPAARRRHRRQPRADRGRRLPRRQHRRHDGPGRAPDGAAPVPAGSASSPARRTRRTPPNGSWRSSRPSRPAPAAASTRSSTGTSRRTAASRPPGSCSAAPRCRRQWSARTIRWPSACCASCSGRASGSRRTWP